MKQNVLLSKARGELTARKSIQAILNYALDQDKKFYSRNSAVSISRGLFAASLLTPLAFGVVYYFTITWQKIHPGGMFNIFMFSTKKPLTSVYAPELYLKETAEIKLRVVNKVDGYASKLWT